jgi:tetratricopeptide (TPR) repeat protein
MKQREKLDLSGFSIDAFYKNKEYEKSAKNILEKISKMSNQASSLADNNNYNEALILINQALELYQDTDVGLKKYLDNLLTKESKNIINDITFKKHIYNLTQTADKYLGQGEYELAIKYFEDVLKLNPSSIIIQNKFIKAQKIYKQKLDIQSINSNIKITDTNNIEQMNELVLQKDEKIKQLTELIIQKDNTIDKLKKEIEYLHESNKIINQQQTIQAIKIQKTYRGYIQRKNYHNIKQEKINDIQSKSGNIISILIKQNRYDEVNKLINAIKLNKLHEATLIINKIE